MKTLVIGCGYIGLPFALAEQLRGYEITAWVHSPASAEALAEYKFSRVIAGSVANEELWKTVGEHDRVIHCASSGRGGAEAYREVFLKGVRMMNAYQPQARWLLVSSTSVYGQTQGEIVSESSTAEPAEETGKILREAERAALENGTMVVRSAGIYGPGRGVLFEKLRRGEAVMEGDGSRWMNRVHRDDLVEAIAFLLQKGKAGEIYNVSDDTPVMQRDFYAWCSAFLRKPMPPSGPVEVQRKRGSSNKRVANAKLRGLGWAPRFPSFREGLRMTEETNS